MSSRAYKLVFAAQIVGRVSGVMLKTDDLDQQNIEITIPDDAVGSSSAVVPEESTVDETTIEILMEQTSCTRDEALNALLSHDKNLDEALAFIQGSFETMTVSESSSIPVQKALPSGRVWGLQSEINISSQMNDTISAEESVVIQITEGLPESIPTKDDTRWEKILTPRDGIFWDIILEDGIVFQGIRSIGWLFKHTSPRISNYAYKKYRFTKVNDHNVNNEEEFCQAIASLKKGDLWTFTLAKKLFSQGDGYNQLFGACKSGDLGIVKRVVEGNPGLDINKGVEGSNEDVRRIYGMSDYKYNTNMMNINRLLVAGFTALHLACFHDHSSIIQELLNHPNINVNKSLKGASENNFTPLRLACFAERSNAVRVLLANKDIDVNETNYSKDSALLLATGSENLDIVKQLIAHPSIDVNIRSRDGKTALMEACYYGKTSIVECLLAHPQIDTTATSLYGETKTALTIASEDAPFWVTQEGASDDARKNRVRVGRAKIVKMLKEHKGKPILR